MCAETTEMHEGDLCLDLYLGQYIEPVADEILAYICNAPKDDIEIVDVYSTPEDIDFYVSVVVHNPDVLDRITDKIATYEAIDKALSTHEPDDEFPSA